MLPRNESGVPGRQQGGRVDIGVNMVSGGKGGGKREIECSVKAAVKSDRNCGGWLVRCLETPCQKWKNQNIGRYRGEDIGRSVEIEGGGQREGGGKKVPIYQIKSGTRQLKEVGMGAHKEE